MIEEKKSLPTRYLTFEALKTLYGVFFERFKEFGEPIPHWDYVDKKNIEHLAEIPQMSYEGGELYPTLESKAAIIFYKINKGHIFPNGNKRFSVACTVVFLAINNHALMVDPDDMTLMALDVAKSDPKDFDQVKAELETWIRSHLAATP